MMGPKIRPSEPADWRIPRVSPYSSGGIDSVAMAVMVGLASALPRGIRVFAKSIIVTLGASETMPKPAAKRGTLIFKVVR